MSSPLKTYWHLQGARRVPSEYEIGTSRLLYYVERGGFAVNLPTSAWYQRNQTASPLVFDRWEDFEDPRATTYSKYVRTQRDQEMYVARLLNTAPTSNTADAPVPDGDWLDVLDRVWSPVRFVFHGLQMIAAYVGQMAPSGRIVVATLFQAADEVRRIHGIAYRMGQLRQRNGAFGSRGRALWQTEAAWQPLRRVIETLLVTFDWGEALVALNVCVKPILDHLFVDALATLSERHGDHVDAQLLRSFADDSAWQRDWTARLLQMVTAREGTSRAAVAGWIMHWRPLIESAARQIVSVFPADAAACTAGALEKGAVLMEMFTTRGPDAV